jgi:catechol 2,3-dioxygenase-like lactoylglutathione lyase family enzyme
MHHRGLLHHLVLKVADLARATPFYDPVLRALGYELTLAEPGYQDWKRWELGTPHRIVLIQAQLPATAPSAGGPGFHHLAFAAAGREDVDRFHAEVLVPLAERGLCVVEDPPCDCPEYEPGYYATFFRDHDGLRFEFVWTPAHDQEKARRDPPAPGR